MHLSDYNAALRNLAALVDFSNLVNSSLNLDFTLNNILLTCFSKFHTTKGIIALADESGRLEVKASKGLAKPAIENFPDCRLNEYSQNEQFNEFLAENNLPLVQEIRVSEDKKGLLILGARLMNKNYEPEDIDFLSTILSVGATAIENSVMVGKLKRVNRDLDAKVNQLSSLFDLSKEFSGVLNVETVGKLLVYSIIGQMLVSRYAVLTCHHKEANIIESKFNNQELKTILDGCDYGTFTRTVAEAEIIEKFPAFRKLGVELIVPMQIKGETKGLILLGKRKNELAYSKSDAEFVSSVGSLAIISIENARLFKETLEKQRLEKDLETARNIQNNLLPKNLPVFPAYEIASFNAPARMVGGDYFDIVKLDEDRLLIAIADVSGKGVPAALLMANVQAFLKSICKQKMPLDEATNLMNDLVSENTTLGSFITFFWAVFDLKTKQITYVNAGHNPPLHVRDGKINKLKKGGMILGVMATMIPYSSEIIQLNEDDAIILFTDGITEAMNPDGEEFSDESLEKIAVENAHFSAADILEKIKTEVQKFTYGAEQSDDITCLVIKVK